MSTEKGSAQDARGASASGASAYEQHVSALSALVLAQQRALERQRTKYWRLFQAHSDTQKEYASLWEELEASLCNQCHNWVSAREPDFYVDFCKRCDESFCNRCASRTSGDAAPICDLCRKAHRIACANCARVIENRCIQ